MTGASVWVHVESDGQQWRVLGVFEDPDVLILHDKQGWEKQGRHSFARIRDDGWYEWLEPAAFRAAERAERAELKREKPAEPVTEQRSPWARPVRDP